jgi:hypothetical protein
MAGSVTVSKYLLSQDKRTLVIKLACVGDSSDGTVPNTTITDALLGTMNDFVHVSSIHEPGGPIQYAAAGFSLKEVWAVVGATAPDAADVTITDALGCAIYSEVGVIPASGTKAGSVTARLVTSNLTVAVANQDTASATYDLYLKLSR